MRVSDTIHHLCLTCSEKMDVECHYVAWRQRQEGALPGADGGPARDAAMDAAAAPSSGE